LVSQKPAILNMSLRNNILLGLRRQGDTCLNDSEGPLDVGYLQSITSLADLDRRLAQFIREVGLEDDVFYKCMETVVNSGTVAAFVHRLAEVRGVIAAGLNLAEGDLISLSGQMYFPGSVCENLFGPGFAATRTLEDAVGVFGGLAKGSAVYTDVMRLGWSRLRREQALAVRVVNRAPGLARLLKVSPGDGEFGLAEELKSADVAALHSLPHRLQGVLVEAGLDHDPGKNYGRPSSGSFEERILEVRERLIKSDSGARLRWEAVESESVCNGLTVRENLLRGRCHPRRRDAVEQADAVIRDVLKQRKLMDDAVLVGLEFRAGEDGNFLSGGQKQKLAMARVLMKDPRILLLDEATSAMDEVSQRRIVELVRSRFAGKTVVSISHRLTTVRDYDRILVLDRGRKIESGKFEQLVEQRGMFSQLVCQETGQSQPAILHSTPPRPGAAAGESNSGDEFRDSEIARQLSLCPLFADLRSDRLAFLAQIARVFNFRAGELLFRRGEAGEEIFVVLDGEVEFFMPEQLGSAEKSVTHYESGRAFGELAVFGHGVRSLSARATVPCRIAAIGREQLLPLMSAEPHIALALLKALSQRLVELTEVRMA